MRAMKTGTLQQLCKRYVMLTTEHLHRVLANQHIHCQRILVRISQIIINSTAKSHLSHAILTRKVNVSEGTTVDILMTLQLTMRMTNDLTSLKLDNVTTSPSQSRGMIVNRVLTIKVSLVGLMPSVLLPVDAQTTTHMVSRKLKEDN